MSIRSKALRAAPYAALLLLGVPAFAQGTAEQRSACTSDVMRLCASSIPDPDRISACLTRQHSQVSAACQTVMRGPGESAVEVAATGSVRRRAAP